MDKQAEAFETHYRDYLDRISQTSFENVGQQLGLEVHDAGLVVHFFNRKYSVFKDRIEDDDNNRPHYGICVIIAQYILRCPQSDVEHKSRWVAFKDFKKMSMFTNENFFRTDCEQAIANHFSNQLENLDAASQKLGGRHVDLGLSYDRIIQFDALPTISLLLLFNDSDELFPTECKVLFQAHAEDYLDPESLAMTGAALAQRLKDA